jgi:hypothetical protein
VGRLVRDEPADHGRSGCGEHVQRVAEQGGAQDGRQQVGVNGDDNLHAHPVERLRRCCGLGAARSGRCRPVRHGSSWFDGTASRRVASVPVTRGRD